MAQVVLIKGLRVVLAEWPFVTCMESIDDAATLIITFKLIIVISDCNWELARRKAVNLYQNFVESNEQRYMQLWSGGKVSAVHKYLQ